MGQITLSLLLYMYGQSLTTTSNSLKALFNEEATFSMSREESLDIGSYLDIPPTYAIVLNFAFSLMSFTWLVLLLIYVSCSLALCYELDKKKCLIYYHVTLFRVTIVTFEPFLAEK